MNFFTDSLLTLKGIKRYKDLLQESQFFSEEQVLKLQKEWLSTLLKHCQSIPWYSIKYREYGVNPQSNDPFKELRKLPILSKKEVLDNHADFCIPAVQDNSLSFFTSGTTGEPLRAYTSKNQWIIEQGVIWRSWKWAGYNLRDRIAIFRSYSPKKGEPKRKLDRLKNWAYFSVYDMTDSDLEEYFTFLQSWKPKFLRGYPSSLYLIAQYALKKGYKLPYLKAAFTASESLAPDFREVIRDAFNIEVFDHYGQAEVTCMLHDCEKHEGMHLDWEYGFVELEPNSNQNNYSIIATNLHNFAMPLLRYDTGDVCKESWSDCGCDRKSKVIGEILGRRDDYIYSSEGSKIPTVNIYTYFSKLTDLKRFQIIQEKRGSLLIKFSIWEGNKEDDSSLLSNKIKRELESLTKLTIETQITDNFTQNSGGKFPVLIQRTK